MHRGLRGASQPCFLRALQHGHFCILHTAFLTRLSLKSGLCCCCCCTPSTALLHSIHVQGTEGRPREGRTLPSTQLVCGGKETCSGPPPLSSRQEQAGRVHSSRKSLPCGWGGISGVRAGVWGGPRRLSLPTASAGLTYCLSVGCHI